MKRLAPFRRARYSGLNFARVMHKGRSVSVVIPARNEEGGIDHLIENIPAYVDESLW